MRSWTMRRKRGPDLLGGRYQRTTAVLFRDATQSACGFAQSATGPFYCPADRKVYLDLGILQRTAPEARRTRRFRSGLRHRARAGSPRADDPGIESQVRRQQAADASARNELSVRMELQADCFAGVWGSPRQQGARRRADSIQGIWTKGINAAAAIGDDRLQRMQGGRVAPERFTHGTSEQRAEWLRRGIESGDPNSCDTFSRQSSVVVASRAVASR